MIPPPTVPYVNIYMGNKILTLPELPHVDIYMCSGKDDGEHGNNDDNTPLNMPDDDNDDHHHDDDDAGANMPLDIPDEDHADDDRGPSIATLTKRLPKAPTNMMEFELQLKTRPYKKRPVRDTPTVPHVNICMGNEILPLPEVPHANNNDGDHGNNDDNT